MDERKPQHDDETESFQAGTSTEDVSTLYSLLSLESSMYKSFPPNRLAKPPVSVESAHVPGPERRRAALGRLMEETGSAPEPGLSLGRISLIAAGGGMGKTSLLAHLARVFADGGEEVVLVNDSVQSLLPYYFGGVAGTSGVSTFRPPADSTRALIHVLAGSDSATPSASGENWIQKGLARFTGKGTRVLFDVAGDAMAGLQSPGLPETRLAIITPDMNSALGLRRLQGVTPEARKARDGGTYFVLNRFDPSIPFHSEMREWLERQLGDRLAPVAIRYASEVQEAMAEGLTVFDYAPTSAVAEDYLSTARWLRRLVPKAESRAGNRV